MTSILLAAILAGDPTLDAQATLSLAAAVREREVAAAVLEKKTRCGCKVCTCVVCDCHYGNRCEHNCKCDNGKGKIAPPSRVYRVGHPDQHIARPAPMMLPAMLPAAPTAVPYYQPAPRPVYQAPQPQPQPVYRAPEPMSYYQSPAFYSPSMGRPMMGAGMRRGRASGC